MSAYLTLLTPMTDEACLLAALVDLGITAAMVEVHATPAGLIGWTMNRRAQVANIVIRREQIGTGSDVGFLSSDTGFQVFVAGVDESRFGQSWLAKLSARYQIHWAAKQERLAAEERRRVEQERQRVVEAQRQAILDRARKMGYQVKEMREGEKIRMVLVKRTY